MRVFPHAAAITAAWLFLMQSPRILPAQTPPASEPASQPATTRPSQAAVLAANSVVHLDVPYGGPDPTLNVLDIYSPANVQNAPILVFVHGGEWTRGDKKDISYKPAFFNAHGIIVVAPNYRLTPRDLHPAQVDDVARAIAWTRDHAKEYGGNPGRIVVLGHSAGCHLVTLLSLDPTPLGKVGMKPSDLRGTVAWSGGMYDLVLRANSPGSYPPYIKATFGTSAEAQHAASPMTYVTNAKSAPPFLIASVDDERSQASREASDLLVKGINENGGQAQSALLAGKSHFTANHELGAPDDKSVLQLMEFFTRVTK